MNKFTFGMNLVCGMNLLWIFRDIVGVFRAYQCPRQESWAALLITQGFAIKIPHLKGKNNGDDALHQVVNTRKKTKDWDE